MVAARAAWPLLLPLAIGAGVTAGQAAIVPVAPGPGTPLQTAIDLANPGDTLRLAAGTFTEGVTVSKRLRIVGAHQGSPRDRTQPNLTTIDAGCGAPYAVDVAADRVRLERLDVRRGSEGGVRIAGRDQVHVWDLRLTAAQGDPDASCGTERYGFLITGGGRIKLAGGAVRGRVSGSPSGLGFLTAGILIANVVAHGRIDVREYASVGNAIGVLVEDSLGPGVKLKGLTIAAVDTGVLLRNTVAIHVLRNRINAANGLTPAAGIALDAQSSRNRLSVNEITGAASDILDQGWANCWRRNIFITGQLPFYNCL